MNHTTNSFSYTRQVLRTLTRQAFEEVQRLGGNPGVEAILKKLEVEEPSEEAEKGLEEALGRLRTQSANGEGESTVVGIEGKKASLKVNGVNGHGLTNGGSPSLLPRV